MTMMKIGKMQKSVNIIDSMTDKLREYPIRKESE
jgi:hypothetical protein